MLEDNIDLVGPMSLNTSNVENTETNMLDYVTNTEANIPEYVVPT